VIARLLEEPWLRIEGISGTSAGAMNTAVLWPATRREARTVRRRYHLEFDGWINLIDGREVVNAVAVIR
jgi:predicted acylesterase/phospholipase RssA